MTKGKPGFMLYHEDVEAMGRLTDAQFGTLIRAMNAYSRCGETLKTEDPFLEMAFSMMKCKIDHDQARYEDVRKKREAAALASHAANAANAADAANINPNVNPSRIPSRIPSSSTSGRGGPPPALGYDQRTYSLEELDELGGRALAARRGGDAQ